MYIHSDVTGQQVYAIKRVKGNKGWQWSLLWRYKKESAIFEDRWDCIDDARKDYQNLREETSKTINGHHGMVKIYYI